MATLAAVDSVDWFVRESQEMVSAVLSEECTDSKPTRLCPQYQLLNALLPSTGEGLDDEMIWGTLSKTGGNALGRDGRLKVCNP